MHDSLLKAVHGQSPLDQLVDAEDRDRLRSALDSLSEKDRRVLSMRFGIDGKRVHSVAQVANACRLSPQHAEMLITAAKPAGHEWGAFETWACFGLMVAVFGFVVIEDRVRG